MKRDSAHDRPLGPLWRDLDFNVRRAPLRGRDFSAEKGLENLLISIVAHF